MDIGKNTFLPKIFTTFPNEVSIGNNCVFEPNIYFKYVGVWKNGKSIIIANDVFIGKGCEFNIFKKITIGNCCLIASGCKFIDHNHQTHISSHIRMQDPTISEIVIGDDVWLGYNVIVLEGVTIGNGAIVAAGSVVNKSIPPNEIWGGVPAKKISVRKGLI